MFPYLNIGSLQISMYWLMIFAGIALVTAMTVVQRRQYGLSVWKSVALPLLMIALAIVCSAPTAFIDNAITIGGERLYYMNLDSFGAILLFPLLCPLLGRLFSISGRSCLNLWAKAIALEEAFIRIGCWCAGCCGGRELTVGGLSFTLPVRQIESAGCMLILAFLLYREKKEGEEADLYPLFLLLYCPLRFVLEFFRKYSMLPIGLDIFQIWCLIGIAAGVVLLVRKQRRRRPEQAGPGAVRSGAA